ncbi:deaminase domain-containing protein [Nocardia alba]|uniref:Putative deaminase of polymorphic toxin system n=1 Tax=Nocardia alba TaxID=225051 RepID=A0A4R1F6Z5_9NOCA|nr:deaminase domain-containing protein [Nocardia alba]TCJ89380.1 putative deaminase of polymorphic toxin system [Nocardia alba]
MASISPQSYETAAKACYDLSEKFQTVYNSLQTIILAAPAMAGGYQAVQPWSKTCDGRAAAVAMVSNNFARALRNYADILTASNYNWALGEYIANIDPSKGQPPSLPTGFPTELPYGPGIVVGVASSGTYSNGLQTDWTELQDRVTVLVSGGQVPDGDTENLARVATAWKTFANSDPLEYGVSQLLTVASGLERGFGSQVPRDIPNHATNLRGLAHSLRDIRTAAHDIAASVEAHKVALATMRADINTQFAMVVVVTAISIGRSAVTVKEPPTKTKTPSKQQSPNPNENKVEIDIDFLNDAAGAIAGPANIFLTTLGGLTFTAAELTNGDLLTIVALPILITERNGVALTDQGHSPINGAEEAQKVRERLAASGETIKKTRNVAVARGEINGQQISLDAVSGDDSPTGTVSKPENPVLEPRSDDGLTVRPTDSEFKILDSLAQQLGPDATGTINLYTEREPCDACDNVVEQFMKKYPGVKVKVTYGA